MSKDSKLLFTILCTGILAAACDGGSSGSSSSKTVLTQEHKTELSSKETIKITSSRPAGSFTKYSYTPYTYLRNTKLLEQRSRNKWFNFITWGEEKIVVGDQDRYRELTPEPNFREARLYSDHGKIFILSSADGKDFTQPKMEVSFDALGGNAEAIFLASTKQSAPMGYPLGEYETQYNYEFTELDPQGLSRETLAYEKLKLTYSCRVEDERSGKLESYELSHTGSSDKNSSLVLFSGSDKANHPALEATASLNILRGNYAREGFVSIEVEDKKVKVMRSKIEVSTKQQSFSVKENGQYSIECEKVSESVEQTESGIASSKKEQLIPLLNQLKSAFTDSQKMDAKLQLTHYSNLERALLLEDLHCFVENSGFSLRKNCTKGAEHLRITEMEDQQFVYDFLSGERYSSNKMIGYLEICDLKPSGVEKYIVMTKAQAGKIINDTAYGVTCLKTVAAGDPDVKQTLEILVDVFKKQDASSPNAMKGSKVILDLAINALPSNQKGETNSAYIVETMNNNLELIRAIKSISQDNTELCSKLNDEINGPKALLLALDHHRNFDFSASHKRSAKHYRESLLEMFCDKK